MKRLVSVELVKENTTKTLADCPDGVEFVASKSKHMCQVIVKKEGNIAYWLLGDGQWMVADKPAKDFIVHRQLTVADNPAKKVQQWDFWDKVPEWVEVEDCHKQLLVKWRNRPIFTTLHDVYNAVEGPFKLTGRVAVPKWEEVTN